MGRILKMGNEKEAEADKLTTESSKYADV